MSAGNWADEMWANAIAIAKQMADEMPPPKPRRVSRPKPKPPPKRPTVADRFPVGMSECETQGILSGCDGCPMLARGECEEYAGEELES